MTIGENIKHCRLVLDMTLEEVANKIGISRQTLSRYETGIINNIPSDKIEALAHALNTTPAKIMGWEGGAEAVNDHAKASSKHKIEILARNLDELPNEDRDKLIKNFEDTIDIYLKARGIKHGSREE